MDLFFEEIVSSFQGILDSITVDARLIEKDKYQKLESALSHAKMLLSQSKKASHLRTVSILQSSWQTVVKTGKEFGVYGKYLGNSKLREQLKEFLKGK